MFEQLFIDIHRRYSLLQFLKTISKMAISEMNIKNYYFESLHTHSMIYLLQEVCTLLLIFLSWNLVYSFAVCRLLRIAWMNNHNGQLRHKISFILYCIVSLDLEIWSVVWLWFHDYISRRHYKCSRQFTNKCYTTSGSCSEFLPGTSGVALICSRKSWIINGMIQLIFHAAYFAHLLRFHHQIYNGAIAAYTGVQVAYNIVCAGHL